MAGDNENQLFFELFPLIDAAADAFEKMYGELDESSNFELYGEHLEKVIIEFNQQRGVNLLPDEVLMSWCEHIERSIEEDQGIMEYMVEAMQNWNNLNQFEK